MKKFFGTDGVRGLANEWPMTPEVALALGQAIAYRFKHKKSTHRIIIGKDTRRSSYMIEQAIAAGVCSMGCTAIFTGPLPTPGIAYLTKAMRADAGVMISASHNRFQDNGIKFFDPSGFKLSDEIELELESFVENQMKGIDRPTGELVGNAFRIEDAQGRYIEFVKKAFPKDLSLEGLRIVVDCAHGAAYKIAPNVLWELGAEVLPIGVNPNGTNINKDRGATAPQAMQRYTQQQKADIGIALDGDADRVILCDENGDIIDGDKVIALSAIALKNQGLLDKNAIVGTIMTNLGVENFLKENGIQVFRTSVGDRYIMEKMREENVCLGGEPSGHVIFSRHATTGDGLIAGLQALACLVSEKVKLSELVKKIPLYPQVSSNIPVKNRIPLEKMQGLQNTIIDIEKRLEGRGRTVVRYSGTEPVLRLMIEGQDEAFIAEELQVLQKAVEEDYANS
jgi:phosphoglucosamine mutase